MNELESDKIRENIEQGRVCTDLMILIEEEASRFTDSQRFYQLLHSMVEHHLPKPAPLPTKMTEEQARRFERSIMPFGEYLGVKIMEVPRERLAWYADQKFSDKLRLYLKSDRGMEKE